MPIRVTEKFFPDFLFFKNLFYLYLKSEKIIDWEIIKEVLKRFTDKIEFYEIHTAANLISVRVKLSESAEEIAKELKKQIEKL